MNFLEIKTFSAITILLWTSNCLLAQRVNNQHVANSAAVDHSLGSTYFFYQRPEYPRDCQEVQDHCSSNNSSGVYFIKPDGYPDPFEVYCDNIHDSGGWTVFHRRSKGDVYFNRSWTKYKHGFGFLSHEFWLGNHKLSYMTNQKEYELRIEMTNSDGISFFLSYDKFRISDEFSNYNLASLGNYSGNAGMLTTWCPTNTGYRNCSCQRTCQNPYGCLDTCSDIQTCVCAEEYYLKEGKCVLPEECGCYAFQKLIPEGEFYANSDCTRRATCNNDQLTWDESYRCNSNAVCEEREDVRKCYCNSGYVGDGQTCTTASDCLDIYNSGVTDNGVYLIKPPSWPGSPFEVYCNMSDGGGWTVFQRRIDGTTDFYRTWDSYKNGFGFANHEMWLGNEKLYYLTNQKRYSIRIDVVNREGTPYYAKFDYFRINNENDKYRLSQLGAYSGTADERSNPDGYFLRYHLNYAFSTRDRDNDVHASLHCAQHRRGAWWYKSCDNSNLNGDYHASQDSYESIWMSYIPGPNYNLKFTEMKIRPF